jgi:hypothetical protein
MSKLFSALLLSSVSLSVSAAPPTLFESWNAATSQGVSFIVTPPASHDNAVFGGSFYVVDASKPIEFTFVTSFAGYDHAISVGSMDTAGNIVWTDLYQKIGASHGPDEGFYALTTFDAAASGYYATGSEVFFRIHTSEEGSFYSGPASNNYDGVEHVVSFYDYSNGKTLVGFEDLSFGGDMNYDDFVILVSNVQSTPIPEPETWAMLLAGLAMVGALTRRRKTTM